MIKKQKAFTLIELLVVIAVIGLLSSVVLVSLGPARTKSRDARRQSDLRQVNTAMEICYDDATCQAADSYLDTAAGAAANTVIGTYLSVPTDPTNTVDQVYKWTNGTTAYYCIYVKLESTANTWLCASNLGVKQKTLAGYTPSNGDCCGYDID